MPASPLTPYRGPERVPVKTIVTTIALVALTYVLWQLVVLSQRVLVWALIAGFFAVALYPLVGWVERRVGGRRWLATLIVFLLAALGLTALASIFLVPLVREGADLARNAPSYVEEARAGRGPLGALVERFNIDDYVERNEARIREQLTGLSAPALNVLRTAAETVAGVLTIIVLAYLMVLEGPKLVDGALNVVSDDRRRERIRTVGSDCAKTVTGYLSGNLLISLICGLLTFVVLLALGVPYAGLIALFVAVCDLIPLVGATIGAVVATAAGFLDSVTAGVAVLVFFVVYQQLENHLLQPVIFARTVKLNALTVLVAILLGVELAGILGALLAIPVAGIIQVVVRDVWDNRRGRLKDEPTVGEDERPALEERLVDGPRRDHREVMDLDASPAARQPSS